MERFEKIAFLNKAQSYKMVFNEFELGIIHALVSDLTGEKQLSENQEKTLGNISKRLDKISEVLAPTTNSTQSVVLDTSVHARPADLDTSVHVGPEIFLIYSWQIKLARNLLCLTQEALASQSGVSNSVILRAEAAENILPISIEDAYKIKDFLSSKGLVLLEKAIIQKEYKSEYICGGQLRAARVLLGLTQATMGERIDLSASLVSKYENLGLYPIEAVQGLDKKLTEIKFERGGIEI